MTEDRMALVELLQKSGDGDFLRSFAEAVLQILMEADIEGVIGAGRHERSAERLRIANANRVGIDHLGAGIRARHELVDDDQDLHR